MGSGQSVAVQDHLQRWETALAALEQVSASSRRMMDQDRIYGSNMESSKMLDKPSEEDDERAGARRPSSLVSFNNAINGSGNPNGGPIGASNGESAVGISSSSLGHTRRSNQASPETRGMEPKTGFSYTSINGQQMPQGSGDGMRSAGGAGSATGQGARHTRQQVLEIKKTRVALFKSYEAANPDALSDVMQCSHFGATAVALSYLLGGDKNCRDRRRRVTVEDIFFAAQVPLHMLHTGAPHLPVMTDIVREFLDVDNRFKDEYGLEALHLDVSPTVGQVNLGPNEVGDRQTRMQLPEFRRVITQDCEEETQIIRIVNYDPYVLEQEMLVDAYEDEDDLNSPLATSVLGNPRHVQRRFSPNNDGAYAVIVDVRNAVQLMVTIAEGVVNDSLHVKTTEVPAASLFKAMMTAEEGHRARGFIRIFRKDCVPEITTDEMKQFWTPELCSGKVLGTTLQGTHASVISSHISSHIVAVAWAMHLLGGVRPGTHGYGNGLPVSDIIRTMKFPVEIFLHGVLPLDQVFEYAREYMRRANYTHVVRLYPVLTKISREDAVPTISVFDLESILIDVRNANEDPEEPEHVMVIMYNASVAHNVLYIVDDPQWCVLAGYDQEAQTAVLIDAHPKTFSRTWTCPLDRLHKAMTGNGYMVFSKAGVPASSRGKSSESSQCGGSSASGCGERCVGAPQSIAPMVQARLQLLEMQDCLGPRWNTQTIVKSFNYPNLSVMPTIVAMACSRVGVPTIFEDVIQMLPYEVSSLLIRYFTLESLHVCLVKYLHHSNLDKDLQVTSYHVGEVDADGKVAVGEQQFEELVCTSIADDNHVLIVHFQSPMLLVHGASHPFGSLGIVTDFNETAKTVVVSDCNPNSYQRTWTVPLHHLYEATMDTDVTRKHRTRGCLLVTRNSRMAGDALGVGTTSRGFKLEILPVQNLFHVSPSPHFQGMSFAFAQLGHFYSPEEIFYEAYLKTVDDQRRRGSQAFAWRDVDVTLSVINRNIDAAFMAQVCSKFLESRGARQSSTYSRLGSKSLSFEQQQQQEEEEGNQDHIIVERLDDVDTGDELVELLTEVTTSTNTVLLLNYDVLKAHNLLNMDRSVALIKSFNAEKKLVELWDAEYAVFGLSITVSIDKLVEIGDLENDGRSPFGFVKFTRTAGSAKKKGLMRAPLSQEEEAEMDAALEDASGRRKDGGPTFV